MLNIRYRTQFKKDYKKIIKHCYNPKEFSYVVTILTIQESLPAKPYKKHIAYISANVDGTFTIFIGYDFTENKKTVFTASSAAKTVMHSSGRGSRT